MASTTGVGTKRFGEKRQAIIHAASVLINENGVQATTLSDVARAIGLNATSITYYFSRKDHLAVAVYEATLDRMEEMAREAAAEPTTELRIRKFVALHVALRRYREVVEVLRSFFEEAGDAPDRALNSARAHILLEAVMWWPVWSLRYSTPDFPRVERCIADILCGGIPKPQGRWEPKELADRSWRTETNGEPNQNEEFLRAATIMINQRGYRGASVNRIAEALNVTKGSFYHHHEAKDDLVLACFQKSYDRLSACQMAGQNSSGDYWSRLSSVLHELIEVQFFDDMPLLRTTALQALDSEHKRDVVTRSNRLARRFAGMLIDGIADGSVRPIDPLVASQIIMSTLNGAYEARRWADRFDQPEDAIRTYVSTLCEGMLARPG